MLIVINRTAITHADASSGKFSDEIKLDDSLYMVHSETFY